MKKSVIISAMLILICLFGIWVFLSLCRSGGEVGFKATVTNIDGDFVYTSVTEDRAGFGSRKLPETIVIYKEFFLEQSFRVGDLIHGNYIRKEYKGEFYQVVSIVINGEV